MQIVRPLALEDASRLADLQARGRDRYRPWDPERAEDWFTAEGQRREIESVLARVDAGGQRAFVILDEAGEVVGRVSLSSIVRGALQSGSLSYWIDASAAGRGLVTSAVSEVVAHAFGQLGLHRVEASTRPENVRSQAVLTRLGFERYGLAPKYLRIAGEWRDHVLFQRLAD